MSQSTGVTKIPPRRMRVRLRVALTAAATAGASLAAAAGYVPAARSVAVAPLAVTAPAMRPAAVLQPGYWLVASDGGIFPFGNAVGYGSTGNIKLNQPIVGMEMTPDLLGYWLVAADGGIFTFGSARGFGTMAFGHINQPIVGMSATASGKGYWMVAADGGIFPFGNAVGYGSTGGIHLNKPIVGMARTATGKGYWLVASDGGIFPFGDAIGYGSTGGMTLNQPIVGMAADTDGKGYWLVAADGGIFPFGSAIGLGSTGGMTLNKPIVGMSAAPDGLGYWLVASDGGIFPFGTAAGLGSTGGMPLNKPIVAMASTGQALGPNDHLAGLPAATSLTAAQGAAGVVCSFTLTNHAGAPVPGVQLNFATTSRLHTATLSTPSALTDANGQVTVTMFDSTSGDSGNVEAIIAGTNTKGIAGPFTITNSAPAFMTAKPTGNTALNADVGNAAGLTLTFTVTDAQNNPVPNQPIQLTQSGLPHAQFSTNPPLTDVKGVATVVLHDTFGNRLGQPGDSGRVTGTVQGSSPVVSASTALITVTPGAFAQATISGLPSTIAAGHQAGGTLSTFDAYGNPVATPASFTWGGSATQSSPNLTAPVLNPASPFTMPVSATSRGFTITPTNANPSAQLTATAGQVVATSPAFGVTGDVPVDSTPAPTLSITGSTTITAPGDTRVLTIGGVLDAEGNAANGSVAVQLVPGSPSDGGSLTGGTPANDATGTVTATVSIANGAGSFTYSAPNPLPASPGSGTISVASLTTSPTGVTISD